MTGRRATVRDVAAAAGVSVSTVSLVLNNPARVAEPTRSRVLDVVDRLDFVPRADAVARARSASGRIGVVGPFSSHPAAAQRLAGVLAAATGATDVVVFDVPSAAGSTEPLLAGLPRSGRLDGLLVVSLPIDAALAGRARQLGLPLVLVDSRHPGVDAVVTDDAAGGRLAARHLLDRGHRRLGFVGEAPASDSYVPPELRRLAGFQEVAGAGVQVLSPGSVEAWLAAPDGPTAVLAADDVLAGEVLKAARRLGRAVPDELAVVGYDDGEVAEALDLTTVRQPLRETGAVGLELVTAGLARRPRTARTVELDLELHVRATT